MDQQLFRWEVNASQWHPFHPWAEAHGSQHCELNQAKRSSTDTSIDLTLFAVVQQG